MVSPDALSLCATEFISNCTTDFFPLFTAHSSTVMPSEFVDFGSAPASNKIDTIEDLLYQTAQNSAVPPFEFLASRSAPASINSDTIELSPRETDR